MKRLAVLFVLFVLAPSVVHAQANSYSLSLGLSSLSGADELWEGGHTLISGAALDFPAIELPSGHTLIPSLTGDLSLGVFSLAGADELEAEYGVDVSGGELLALSGFLGGRVALDGRFSPYLTAGFGYTTPMMTPVRVDGRTIIDGEVARDEFGSTFAIGVRMGEGDYRPYIEVRRVAFGDLSYGTLSLGLSYR